jgi:hypothetical protein
MPSSTKSFAATTEFPRPFSPKPSASEASRDATLTSAADDFFLLLSSWEVSNNPSKAHEAILADLRQTLRARRGTEQRVGSPTEEELRQHDKICSYNLTHNVGEVPY